MLIQIGKDVRSGGEFQVFLMSKSMFEVHLNDVTDEVLRARLKAEYECTTKKSGSLTAHNRHCVENRQFCWLYGGHFQLTVG